MPDENSPSLKKLAQMKIDNFRQPNSRYDVRFDWLTNQVRGTSDVCKQNKTHMT